MKTLALLPAILLCLVSVSTSFAQEQNADSAYAAMVERLKGGDTTVNFQQMRHTYAESSLYSPYSGPDRTSTMYDSFKDENYEKAIEDANAILKVNYVHIDAHYVCSIAYQMLGDSTHWKYHDEILMGLLNSILQSGDGKTRETAFKVISTTEEYSLLSFMEYKVMKQTLKIEAYPPCDLLQVYDEAIGETQELYFDISLPFSWLSRKFGEPQEVEESEKIEE